MSTAKKIQSALVVALLAGCNQVANPSKPACGNDFSATDTDGNALVSLAEAQAKGVAKSKFDSADKDKSETLNYGEFSTSSISSNCP